MKLTDLKLGFGTLRYVAGEDEVPYSVTQTDDVTFHNHAKPGRPAYYDVSFQVSATVEIEGVSEFTVFSVSIPVIGKSGNSSYKEVESEAARQLAPVLRLFAEDIERQVAASEDQTDVADQA